MDRILKGQLTEVPVRFFFVDSSLSVAEMQRLHKSTAVATAAAGRLLSAGLMMGAMMKNESDALTLRINGNGEIGRIIVVADNAGRAKCEILNPQVALNINDKGKLDVAKAVGIGILTVTMDIGLKQPFSGTIELLTSEIAEDIAYYYAASEQIPTVCALGVKVQADMQSVACAGGFIIQLLPNCPEDVIDFLEARMAELPPMTTLLEEGRNIEEILDRVFADKYAYKIDAVIPAAYHCDCDRRRVERAVISMGRKELEALLAEEEEIEVRCHFCNRQYRFNRAEVEDLIAQL
jgi:molecular chaperone Hsp33